MSQLNISIVIPAYNEEENLNSLISELRGVLDGLGRSYEIIIVDDGSRDRSFEILKEIAYKDPRIKGIRFRQNKGQTAAFDAGFKTAQGDTVITMDADLQNDPHDIPLLLEKIGEFDAVCGWRYRRRDPWIKIISSKIANFVRNKLSQEDIVYISPCLSTICWGQLRYSHNHILCGSNQKPASKLMQVYHLL